MQCLLKYANVKKITTPQTTVLVVMICLIFIFYLAYNYVPLGFEKRVKEHFRFVVNLTGKVNNML